MKISGLSFRGVASLPDLECSFVSTLTGLPHDLVVISGPPASGKTRLCELMIAVLETVGPYQGMVRASDWYADAAVGARAQMDLWVADAAPGAGALPTRAVVDFTARGVRSEIDRAAARQLTRYDHDPAHGKREYFPENRQRAWGAREDGTAPLEQALLRPTKDPQKYSCVPRFLRELRSDEPRRRVFADQLELISSTVRFSPAARSADPTACFTTHAGDRVSYRELSGAEADAVIIAATAAMIGLNNSVIFLDRPELYVPPSRLVPWVQALARMGVGNQWFIASNDDGLVASVDRGQRIALGGGDGLGPSSQARRVS
jgi:hypothetical protein